MTADDARDEQLAIVYLAGMVRESKGVVSHEYVEPGSNIETDAKAALARMLRGDRPLPDFIRWRLAALFDPDSSDERQFSIANRRRGERAKPFVALEIARYVAGNLPAFGDKLDAVQQAAADRYSVSLRTVQRAWAENKDSPLVRALIEANRAVK